MKTPRVGKIIFIQYIVFTLLDLGSVTADANFMNDDQDTDLWTLGKMKGTLYIFCFWR